MGTTQGRGATQREEKKAVTHAGHAHSHTLIFGSSFCEMALSEVIATKREPLPKRGLQKLCTKQSGMFVRRMACYRAHL